MFSTFSHRLSIQLYRFSTFWQNMFKVVCCRIVIWGKGLKHWGKWRNCSSWEDQFLLLKQFQNSSAADAWGCICMWERVDDVLLSSFILLFCLQTWFTFLFGFKKMFLCFSDESGTTLIYSRHEVGLILDCL